MSRAAFAIRPARIADADAIAHVHHQSWEETYPGIMPPELIERVSLDYRLTLWRRIIHEQTPGVARFVAEIGATPGKVEAGFPFGVATEQGAKSGEVETGSPADFATARKQATPGKVEAGFPSGVATMKDQATPAKVEAGFASGVATGKIVAIASCGPAREPELNARYEIHMVYVLREAQGNGVGTALMRTMFDFLNAQNGDADAENVNADHSVGLWTLKGNDRAIRFYESLGAVVTGTVKRDERHGVVIEDVGMRWDTLLLFQAPARNATE